MEYHVLLVRSLANDWHIEAIGKAAEIAAERSWLLRTGTRDRDVYVKPVRLDYRTDTLCLGVAA
jgi:hypothetical protein